MSEFGIRLRYLRKKVNFSQFELANKIGVSKSSINMYERGEREPGFETLEAIADFFNVDMNYLIGGASEQEKPAPESGLSPERQLFTEKVSRLNDSDFQLVLDIIDRVFVEREK